MYQNVPYHVKNLPTILLTICVIHLIVKGLMLKHLWYYFAQNDTNTQFALTGVLTIFLCCLFFSVLWDMIRRTYLTFRYVIGLNISIVACALFIIGYLLGNSVEIVFARWTSDDERYTCIQLGLATNITEEIEPGLSADDFANDNCSEAISLAFYNISIDLIIHIFFVPLHIFATAFSWTFSGLYRRRVHASE